MHATFIRGLPLLYSEKQKQAGWYDLMGRLNQECKDWWDYVRILRQPLYVILTNPISIMLVCKFLREYGEYTTRVFGPGTKLDGYHLQVFGVASRFQKKGLGAKLIDTVEALVRFIST